MSYFPFTPGQQPMSSSLGVVVASDQSPVAVKSSIAGGIFPVSGSVAAVIVGTPNVNTAGSVVAFQGTNPWVVVSSVAGGLFPISGSVAATITNTNVNVSGSVVATQGTTPWIVGSVYGNISGSVVTTQSGTVVTSISGTITVGAITSGASIVGTYSEDIGHTTADKGIFVLGVRNDTVASTASADLDYTIHAVDSSGRTLIKPFASEEARLDAQTSVVSGSVTALFSSVTGLRNYVTDVFVANTGSVAALITFRDGSTSVLGYTIAPAGGGSNIIGMAMPLRTAPGQDFCFFQSPVASILYITAKGYKAP